MAACSAAKQPCNTAHIYAVDQYAAVYSACPGFIWQELPQAMACFAYSDMPYDVMAL
jgi:hypothetical protein